MSDPRPLDAYADVGMALTRAREERDVTLEFAAHALHVPKALLAGLESGTIADFDAPIYYLGHLRRYAAWLGLDPERLIQRLPDTGHRTPAVPVAYEPEEVDPFGLRPGLKIALALLLVIVILSVLWLLRRPHPKPPVAPARTSIPRYPHLADVAPIKPPRVLLHRRELATPGLPPLMLRFVLTHRSWVAVTADGRPVLAKLEQPGHFRLKVQPPVKLVLGNAPGVALFMNGQPFNLVPWTGTDHVAVIHLFSPTGSVHP